MTRSRYLAARRSSSAICSGVGCSGLSFGVRVSSTPGSLAVLVRSWSVMNFRSSSPSFFIVASPRSSSRTSMPKQPSGPNSSTGGFTPAVAQNLQRPRFAAVDEGGAIEQRDPLLRALALRPCWRKYDCPKRPYGLPAFRQNSMKLMSCPMPELRMKRSAPVMASRSRSSRSAVPGQAPLQDLHLGKAALQHRGHPLVQLHGPHDHLHVRADAAR